MVRTERSDGADRVCVVLEPNRSLTWRESLVFFTATALVSMVVALGFAIQGYWPILPFAGLELCALWAALYLVARSGRQRQMITITATTLRVEKGCLRRCGDGGGPHFSADFARAWARVELIAPRGGWYPSQLVIGASGRSVMVGEFLTDDERQALMASLQGLLVTGDLELPPAP